MTNTTDTALAQTTAAALTTAHEIEGYTDLPSVEPGQTLNLFVHLRFPGTFRVTFQRYGAIAADSGPPTSEEPILIRSGEAGGPQAVPDNAYTNGAGWKMTIPQVIGSNWRSGYWAAQLHDERFAPTDVSNDFFVSFIVRDLAQNRKPITVLASTNTWQAYNIWPLEQSGSFYDLGACATHYYPVSLLRPNLVGSPRPYDPWVTVTDSCVYAGGGTPYSQRIRREHVVSGEIRIAQWLEREQWPYSVLSDWDLDRTPGILNTASSPTLILSTHSEYWSSAMLNALRAHLNSGGNVVSLSGNTIYRQVVAADTVTGLDATNHLIGNRTVARALQPNGTPVVWDAAEKTKVIALGHGSDGAPCGAYNPTAASHWAFSTPLSANTSSTMGSFGLMSETSACTGIAGSAGAAAGWETDAASSHPGFFRTYNRLAHSDVGGGAADIVYAKRASAGSIFSVGSITFGQSLLSDSYLPYFAQSLSPLVENILTRFQNRTFSDFNSDGKSDVLTRDAAGTLRFFPGNGAGGLSAPIVLPGAWGSYTALVPIGDFDGNGTSDLLARDSSGNIHYFRGTGVGGFVQDGGPVIDSGWNSIESFIPTGDFTGDGKPDLLARDTGGRLLLFTGNGTGGFVQNGGAQVATGWGTGTFDMLTSAGDFDGDGNADILVRLTANKSARIYFGNGMGGLKANYAALPYGWGTFNKVVGTGDFDGDGLPDFLVRQASTGTVYLARGDGFGGEYAATPVVATGWSSYNEIVGIW